VGRNGRQVVPVGLRVIGRTEPAVIVPACQTSTMRVDEHVNALQQQGELLATATSRADLQARVPTCPEWTVRELVRHMGRVHRWATVYVRDGVGAPLDKAGEAAAWGEMPDDSGLVRWFRDGHELLVAALSAAPADLACWSFLPAPTPLAFWARRQAHETAIHRVDVEAGAGELTDCSTALALDGIEELLTGFYGRPGSRLRADPAVTLGLHATDAPDGTGHWTVTIGPDRVSTAATAQPSDCTVSGRATDLYYLLWNRLEPDRVAVHGDRAVLGLWRERARVRWT
jgi:uncharacterized protein (TIGR03083 family)